MRSRSIIACAFVACALVVLSNGCDDAKEGDPCNALILHDECTGGTTCQIIGSCTVGHCCPADPSTSTNPFCNGMACPPLPSDGGDEGGPSTDGQTDAVADSTSEATADASIEASVEASMEASVEATVEAAAETSTSDAPSEGAADAGGG